MDEPAHSASRHGSYRWLWFALAISPALAPLYLILRFGVDFHYFDEWMPDIARVFIKAHEHELTLADILAQHNEHRPSPLIRATKIQAWVFNVNTRMATPLPQTVTIQR
jgi:hypothetical protein